jgi:ATP-dependent helicase IRC3
MSNLIPCIPCPTPKATKVLLLAHRQELLNQAYNQIKRYNPNLVRKKACKQYSSNEHFPPT